jgi:hypothetical protein
MSQIKLELHVDEINGILGALGQLPYGQVAGLVEKIKVQAIPQVQDIQVAAEAQTQQDLAEAVAATVQ